MVADQTGSGKTLAYLAPLVQRLRCVVVACCVSYTFAVVVSRVEHLMNSGTVV